jgi:hypothetical protein
MLTFGVSRKLATDTPGWLYIAGISQLASIIEVVNGPTKWVVVPKAIEFPHDEGVIDIDDSVEEEDNNDNGSDDGIGEMADRGGGGLDFEEKQKKVEEETEVSDEGSLYAVEDDLEDEFEESQQV